MWQSIFSAAVSLGLSAWLLAEVRPLVDAIFKPYGLNIGWRFFTFSEVSLVFGFVIALGVFGALAGHHATPLRLQSQKISLSKQAV